MENASNHLGIAFESGSINKSGRCTLGVGMFWSGCAGKAKWGLESGRIAAVEIECHTAFHLEAIKTCNVDQATTLLAFNAKTSLNRKSKRQKICKYLIVNDYLAKTLVGGVLCYDGFELISLSRDDSNLRYVHRGEQTEKRGRPKAYPRKVDFQSIDKVQFETISSDQENEVSSGIVSSKALKGNIPVAIFRSKRKGKWTHKLLFSKVLILEANTIFEYYICKFQLEFLDRKAQQHARLNHCQAKSERTIKCSFNDSLTSINMAKIQQWLTAPKATRSSCSMTDIRTRYHNGCYSTCLAEAQTCIKINEYPVN